MARSMETVETTPVTEAQCSHLDTIHPIEPRTTGCEECMAAGNVWVHLRMCMTCGHVGCCDDSEHKHATGHFLETDHPLIHSFEPGEDWLWCYKDQILLYSPVDDPTNVRLASVSSFLKRLSLFAHLTKPDLDQLALMARPATIQEGDLLIEEGTQGDAFYVVLDGEFQVTRRSGKQEIILGTRGPGQLLGEMSLLEQAPRIASVRALRNSRVLVISEEAFHTLLTRNPQVVFAILRTFIARLRSTEALLVQNDKMASLGTLAAGLAHELNNPAAAAQRSADQLRDVLGDWQRASGRMVAATINPEQSDYLASLAETMEKRAAVPAILDPLTRSDREGELQWWLEDRGVEDAWELAPNLVAYGWETSDLEALTERFADEQLPVVATWLATGTAAYGLLGEVSSSAQRISEIVKAVKTYSFLDQAPIQQVDIQAGLENTLVILKHKLKSGVEVERDYDPDLPQIEAYGSELNQVWTNIIDNAIDAMGGHGKIILRTRRDGKYVIVELSDNGPGILGDIQQRIFEPFYTTKGPGVGNGLGLHIVYNIVVDKHHGEVSVQSAPGETCFRIVLPVTLPKEK
ncbi:MAG: ATP-binding protein [Chloroflexia bacterium]